MTGYARAQISSPLGRLQLELRTVNHRYLDISIRMPDELRAHEAPLRAKLSAGVGRGKLDVGLRVLPDPENPSVLQVDEDVVATLGAALDRLRSAAKHDLALDGLNMLRWPGVLREPEVDESRLAGRIAALTDQAIGELAAARRSEGERLADLIAERIDSIEQLVDQVTERLPVQQAAWREKFAVRLEELAELDPERRDQAVVQFLQRLDVDEELVRLRSHCKEVRDCLVKDGPIGRKLDFFMQELNREANTLGSKSMDAEITKLVVELKVTIEQMREQVQNIE